VKFQALELEHDAGEFDEAEEVSGELVLACGGASVSFELGEEALDAHRFL
jgi:hypothetical protein